MSWWKHAREHAREHGDFARAANWGGEGPEHGPGPGFCGPGGRGGWGGGRGPGGPGGAGFGGGPGGRFGGEDGGGFGVRRPLRFLAHKLELTEAQVPELARILDELKTERAQAEVDLRRTIAAFADAMEGATFGEEKSREGGDLRVKSAERLRDAVTTALSRIHAMLEDDQRKRFSYLIRTGIVSL